MALSPPSVAQIYTKTRTKKDSKNTMSPALCIPPPVLRTHHHHHSRIQIPLLRSNITTKPANPIFQNPKQLRSRSRISTVRSCQQNPGESLPSNTRLETLLSAAASLYPVYVTVGGVVAFLKPSTFSWFVERAPDSYSFSLGFIMLSMGLTLEFKDLLNLFMQRPLSILFGCASQYTIMPAFGFVISKLLGLSPSLSVGLILLSCCPGGTASNVVTLLAQGDVPLSIVMTVCSTLAAVFLTPLLAKVLAGTYIHVDAIKISISTMQVVVAPVLLGSYLQSTFPKAVKTALPFAPLLAVLTSSLLACSVFSENVARLKSSMVLTSLSSDISPLVYAQAFLSSEMGMIVLSVLLLHFAGFFVGYIAAALAGFKEPQRRAVSIEVGMQNSSLGVVLAASHFSSAMVAVPPAVSAVIMNIMGSSLGFFWRFVDPSDPQCSSKD
ncbi:probable sodium/metabolite cotransporter BASS2, chloroplastic [Cynara cardunculus var. scolymus]|uniref:probable sodium/metabolite cotransporter BASS2, chloroplastic n=1 Tax=Cynara cardunculus var. scolymus TaxID=59895 RepID=UPI000D62E79C|nr:probable sodium/metabolite cotransporter BASS2, chloroplastic [Cynara cardunculus var. scolymus]